jgi:serpin B
VLLNAIYFKGTWENQFKPKRTHDAPFRLSSKEQVSARLMYQRSKYRLLRKEDFQAIALPYKGEGISMIVLLPHDTDGLTELEKQLTAETLTRWLAELDREPGQETELFLPSFKVETGYDLVPSCRKLGISDAFDAKGQADFRGMGYPKGEVWISQIRHKAFVEVNEEGTEAAAATGVEMGTVSIRDYAVFRADHPFVFVIRENATGSILFLGRMTDPRAG